MSYIIYILCTPSYLSILSLFFTFVRLYKNRLSKSKPLILNYSMNYAECSSDLKHVTFFYLVGVPQMMRLGINLLKSSANTLRGR